LVISQSFSEHEAFRSYKKIVLSEGDYACNSLWINDHLIMPAGFPEVRNQFEVLGMPIIELDVSEVRKMDGGLTCLSLRFSQVN
jgi:dimethylargininase